MRNDLTSLINKIYIKPVLLIVAFALSIVGTFFFYRSHFYFGHYINFLHLDMIAPPDVSSSVKGAILYFIAIVLFILAIKDYKPDTIDDWKFFNDYFHTLEKKNRSIAILFFAITIILTLFIIYQLLILNTFKLYFLLIWVGGLITTAFGLYFWENKNFSLGVFKLDVYEVIFIVLLTIFYFIVVFSLLEYLPYYVETDEGGFGLHTNKLFTDEHNWWSNLWGAWPALSHLPAYLTMLNFGIDIYGLRLSSVITGFLCIYPFYCGVRAGFNKHMAAISTIVLVSSALFIGFSRTGYPNIQSVLVFILIFAFVMFFFKTGEFLYVYLAGIATGASFYTYLANKAFLVVVPLFFLLVLIFYKNYRKQTIKAIILGVTALVLCAYPYFVVIHNKVEPTVSRTSEIFYLLHDASFEHTANQFDERNKALLFVKAFIKSSLVFNYQCGNTSTSIRYVRPYVEFYSSIFFLFGFLLMLMKLKDLRFLFLAINFFVFLLFMSLTLEAPCIHRYLVFIPVTSIIIGYTLFSIASFLADSTRYKQIIFKTIIIVSLLIIILSNFEVFFYNFIYKRADLSMFDKKTIAVKIIKEYTPINDFYIVYNNFLEDFKNNANIINLGEDPMKFILGDNDYMKYVINIDQGDLPLKKNVNKDVVFLIDTDLAKPVNYILQTYKHKEFFVMNNLDNGISFVIIKVSKEVINSKIEEKIDANQNK